MCICAPMDMHMSQARMLTATSKVAEFKAAEVLFLPPLALQHSARERKSIAQDGLPSSPSETSYSEGQVGAKVINTTAL